MGMIRKDIKEEEMRKRIVPTLALACFCVALVTLSSCTLMNSATLTIINKTGYSVLYDVSWNGTSFGNLSYGVAQSETVRAGTAYILFAGGHSDVEDTISAGQDATIVLQ